MRILIYLLFIFCCLNCFSDFVSAKEIDFLVENIKDVQNIEHSNYKRYEDNLVNKCLTNKHLEMPIYKGYLYSDNLAEKISISPQSKIIKGGVELYSDSFAENSLQEYKDIEYKQKKYDFSNLNHTYIKVRPLKNISTKDIKNVGSYHDFVVIDDVMNNGKILIKKDTKIKARIENVAPSMFRGVPANLIVGNFYWNDVPLFGEIEKSGFPHYCWTIPLSEVSGFFVPFSGYVFNLVKGGEAKIKTKEIFSVMIPDEYFSKNQ